MHWEVLATTPAGVVDLLDDLDSGGVSWARFGTQVLVRTDTSGTSAAPVGAAPIASGTDVPGTAFHLVTQKGRTFQQRYPDVPVLLDAGRYLAVVMDPRQVRGTSDPDGDYVVEPLGDRRVVFENRSPASPSARRARSPLGQVDRTSFTADLAYLSALHTRLSTSELFRTAAQWSTERLGALGYAVDQLPITVGTTGTSLNVVARRASSSAEDAGEVLVTAHLDSINHQDGPDAAAPGADDNASGVCGALEIARLLASTTTSSGVTIVLFGGEEQGLYGSRAYVAGLSAADRNRIRAVVNMDMIGRVNADPRTVLLEGAETSRDLIDRLADAAATYTALAVDVSLNPFASDHVPFLEVGIPAVLTIEGGDSANDAVHTARDTADLIDAEFAGEIITLVGAAVAELTLPETPGAATDSTSEGGRT